MRGDRCVPRDQGEACLALGTTGRLRELLEKPGQERECIRYICEVEIRRTNFFKESSKKYLQVRMAFLHMAACSEAECRATPLTATSPHLQRNFISSGDPTHQPRAPGMLLKPGSSFHILAIPINSLPSARISFQLARILSSAFSTPVSSTLQTGLWSSKYQD